MSNYFKHCIKRQADGSYVVLTKDLTNKRLTIDSTHDTYEDAKDAMTDLEYKPSQAETMEFMNDLKDSIRKI